MKTKCLIGSIILAPIVFALIVGLGVGICWVISMIPYGAELCFILSASFVMIFIGSVLYVHCIKREEEKGRG